MLIVAETTTQMLRAALAELLKLPPDHVKVVRMAAIIANDKVVKRFSQVLDHGYGSVKIYIEGGRYGGVAAEETDN